MKLPNQKSLLITFILAILGYIVAEFVLTSVLAPSLLFALGLLIGGLVLASISESKPQAPGELKAETKTLYVGNLPYKANEGIVRELFSAHGTVFSVRLLKDKNTGKRRGFGFVEMALADAQRAVDKLNDTEFQQRTLKVREAKQKQDDEE